MMTEEFDEDTPPEYVAANERLYKALGLMPQDGDLRALTLDLLRAGWPASTATTRTRSTSCREPGGSAATRR